MIPLWEKHCNIQIFPELEYTLNHWQGKRASKKTPPKWQCCFSNKLPSIHLTRIPKISYLGSIYLLDIVGLKNGFYIKDLNWVRRSINLTRRLELWCNKVGHLPLHRKWVPTSYCWIWHILLVFQHHHVIAQDSPLLVGLLQWHVIDFFHFFHLCIFLATGIHPVPIFATPTTSNMFDNRECFLFEIPIVPITSYRYTSTTNHSNRSDHGAAFT